MTRLTWRATKVDAGRIAFAIESKTTASDGRAIASAASDEVHDAAADPGADRAPPGATKSEDATVSGARIPTWVHVRANPSGEVKVWTSPSVPFSGVVRASGGGVEQSLVGFGRGR